MEITPEWADKWVFLTQQLREQYGKTPDLNAVLFLIGINELGMGVRKFKKEEKMDLMHIAICELLSRQGYYAFVGRDEDGWPHYDLLKEPEFLSIAQQEMLLKSEAVRYFEALNEESR